MFPDVSLQGAQLKRLSPNSNRLIEDERYAADNILQSAFCAASASAFPPTPSPASAAVASTSIYFRVTSTPVKIISKSSDPSRETQHRSSPGQVATSRRSSAAKFFAPAGEKNQQLLRQAGDGNDCGGARPELTCQQQGRVTLEIAHWNGRSGQHQQAHRPGAAILGWVDPTSSRDVSAEGQRGA